jgi:hypothetical protein
MPLGSGVRGCGGGFEPPTFGFCDLTHLSMRVGLYLHPRGMLAIQSLPLPPPFRGLGSVLPYRSRDVGFTDLEELPAHSEKAKNCRFRYRTGSKFADAKRRVFSTARGGRIRGFWHTRLASDITGFPGCIPMFELPVGCRDRS